MTNQEKTTIYIDPEARDRLKAQAEQHGRTTVGQMRWLLDNNLDLLPPFDLAVLHQIAQDQSLDTPIAAASYVIRDWQRLNAILASAGA